MSQTENLPGVRLTFHILSEEEVKVELEWDQENEDSNVPQYLINLLSYIRGDQGVKSVINIYKQACKSLKRKDLYREFTIMLKTMALEKLIEKEAPMISALEVLGKKRMS